MYEGSMYGAGLAVFAVWGYVIAHTIDSRVELNPKRLADTLGGEVGEVEGAIEYLRKQDPQSRHKEYDGARLVKQGEFQYLVPSWPYYRAIQNEDERREYNRQKQAERRVWLKMTALERKAYEAARNIEYVKRRKVGLREAKKEGGVAGAVAATQDGMEEVKA